MHFRHVYSTRTFVIPVIVFTLIYNVPKFFELEVEYIPMDHLAKLQEFNPNATFNSTGFDWDSYDGKLINSFYFLPCVERLGK